MSSNQKPGEPLSPLEGHFGTVTALTYNSGRLQLFRWCAHCIFVCLLNSLMFQWWPRSTHPCLGTWRGGWGPAWQSRCNKGCLEQWRWGQLILGGASVISFCSSWDWPFQWTWSMRLIIQWGRATWGVISGKLLESEGAESLWPKTFSQRNF